jgi:putative ABC transport system ATP-binding protein
MYAAELVLLYGPSGSGKSTMLNLLSGLDNPTEGTIKFMGEDISEFSEKKLTTFRRDNVGFVFQDWKLIPNLNAYENVEAPMYPSNMPSNELRTEAISTLRELDLLDREHHFPGELSGGEQQRVAIARAIMKKPKIIFADEPTGNLDKITGNLIMRVLKRVCRQGTTVIVATHNEELKDYADKIIYLDDGKMISHTR